MMHPVGCRTWIFGDAPLADTSARTRHTVEIILETNAPGPNPFTPDKGEGFRDVVEAQLAASAIVLAGLATRNSAARRSQKPQ